jgi:hypothetical protein
MMGNAWELVQGRAVTCIRKDRYQRVVASCQVGGADLGEQVVRFGNALDYRRYRQAELDAVLRPVTGYDVWLCIDILNQKVLDIGYDLGMTR